MTTPSEVAIGNLLYLYAETIDEGRFEDLATDLYANCEFVVGPGVRFDAEKMVDLLCRTTIRYSDGTPRTKHVVSNPMIQVDEANGTATCRSNYVVFQQTDTLPFQAIVAGRYHDRFVRIGGEWRFAERDYSLVDMVGDISQHLRMDLRPAVS
jgi:3-phenylpropionate/cinnamic acid dioxygenase small subunit